MFGRSARIYDAIYASIRDYPREAELVERLVRERMPGARSLLDVACGTGAHLEHLRRRFEHVEGLDLDPEMIAVARERLGEDVPLHEGDMASFELGRRFDAVVCLFSSIGYVQTVGRLQEAATAMARHLEPGGVLLVEPWLTPDVWRTRHVAAVFVDEPELKIARLTNPSREGDVSVLEFHYLVGTPEGVDYFTERHELGLFATDEYRKVFEAAGLRVDHDPEGPMGRGLFLGAAS